MSIVNSETIADLHTQADGRRYITHYFIAHTGEMEKGEARTVIEIREI